MDTNDRRHEDTALREALSRISDIKKQDLLPEDFEQRVMGRMESVKLARRWMKTAVVFIGVLLVSGIAWAVWQLNGRNDKKISSDDIQVETTLQPVETQDSIVRFDNVRLDSVMTVVATHYGKTVVFHNETVRHLRFLIKWNHEAPLSQFIELINNFEGICVTEENDTIFAE